MHVYPTRDGFITNAELNTLTGINLFHPHREHVPLAIKRRAANPLTVYLLVNLTVFFIFTPLTSAV